MIGRLFAATIAEFTGARDEISQVLTQSLFSHMLAPTSEVKEVYFHYITLFSGSNHESHG